MQTPKITTKLLLFAVMLLLLLPFTSNLFAFPDQQKFSVSLSAANGGAEAAAVTPNGRFLGIISGSSGSYVTIVDTSIFAVTATISVGSTPTGIVASDDSRFFYVTTSAANGVYGIELATADGTVPETLLVATQLPGIDVAAGLADIAIANQILFLLSNNGSEIQLYDIAAEKMVSDGSNPILVGFNAQEIRAESTSGFLTALGNGGEFGLFTASGFAQIGATQNFSGLSSGGNNFTGVTLASTSNGVLSFVSNGVSSGEVFGMSLNSSSTPITLLDTSSGSVSIDPIHTGNQPTALLQTGDHLYIANSVDKSVAVVNTGDFFDSTVATVVPVATFTVDETPVRRGLAGNLSADTYLYLAMGSSNKVGVITENPRITLTTPPASEISSSTFVIGFTSDESGAYQIRRNSTSSAGAIGPNDGTLIDSGNAVANQEVTTTLNAALLNDGDNLVHIFLTGSKGVGRTGFKVDVQLPPKAPEGFSLKFGDQKIYVNFKSLDSENTDFYRIYFGNSPSSLNGTTNLHSPVVVDHPGAGKGITEVLSPLANGQIVYVQVVAVNSLGVEGTPTELLSETPENTFGLIVASGETGGCSFIGMNTPTPRDAAPSFIILVLTALFCFMRRYTVRKPLRFFLTMAIIFLAATVGSRTLHAQDDEPESEEEEQSDELPEEFAPLHLSVGIGVNWWFPKTDAVDQFYGDEGNEIFSLRIGFPWQIPSGTLQTMAEGGFLLEDRHLLGASTGRESGDESMLMLIPIRFELLYLIDPPHSWWIAPLLGVNYGWDYFKIEEKGIEVDGFRQSIRAKLGWRTYIDRCVRDPQGWRDVLSVTAAYLDISATYEISLSDSPFKTDGILIGPELGVDF